MCWICECHPSRRRCVVFTDEETKANRGVFFSSSPNECTVEQGDPRSIPSHVAGLLGLLPILARIPVPATQNNRALNIALA